MEENFTIKAEFDGKGSLPAIIIRYYSGDKEVGYIRVDVRNKIDYKINDEKYKEKIIKDLCSIMGISISMKPDILVDYSLDDMITNNSKNGGTTITMPKPSYIKNIMKFIEENGIEYDSSSIIINEQVVYDEGDVKSTRR